MKQDKVLKLSQSIMGTPTSPLIDGMTGREQDAETMFYSYLRYEYGKKCCETMLLEQELTRTGPKRDYNQPRKSGFGGKSVGGRVFVSKGSDSSNTPSD